MATPPNRKLKPKRRNAKVKLKPKHRFRNAAPAPPRAGAAKPPAPKVPMTDKLYELVQGLAGSGATTYLGSQLVKWGLSPTWVSVGAATAGTLLGLIPNQGYVRRIGNGAASAAASQLLLLAVNPTPAPVVASVPTPQPTPQPHPPQAPAKLKNADLGTLPPGMLDAAFERARAELAVATAHDGYGHGPIPEPRFHHGPVMAQ